MSRNPFKDTIDNAQKWMKEKNYVGAIFLLTQLQDEIGFLSFENQIRLVRCYFYTKRYIDALNSISKYVDSGNPSQELIFIKGLCYYYLQQWDKAYKTFALYPSWALWQKKANAMIKIKNGDSKPLLFGHFPTSFDQNTIKYDWYQSSDYISISILLKGVLSDQVEVIPLLHSIDVKIEIPEFIHYFKSFNLSEQIIPSTCETTISPNTVKIKVNKQIPGQMWPALEFGSINENIVEKEVNNMLSEQVRIKEISDQEAADIFKQARLEQKNLNELNPI